MTENKTIFQWYSVAQYQCRYPDKLTVIRHARSSEALEASDLEIDALATNMVVVATYWLSYEYVCHPRKYIEQQAIADALTRGRYQVLSQIGPYLRGPTHVLFQKLAEEYLKKINKE